MLEETLTVILAGGQGSRLQPLTRVRAKPAVPFGGKFRIIDFTLTNCLHSGLRRILVLTQYKSHSLQKHLRDGWSIFNPELGEYVTTVPPQMRNDGSWYSGTANAIHQNLYLLERSGAKWVLILSGDHIYRMDYEPMIRHHIESGANMTVACMEVDIDEARSFGVMGIDSNSRITSFEEKPGQPQTVPGSKDKALASMGIYVFSMDCLQEVLAKDHDNPASSHDFGKDIIPQLVDSDHVSAYQFGTKKGRVTPDSYWRDVGTIDAYYEANMDLLKPVPPINLYQSDWPIRTYQAQYPPARTVPGKLGNEGIAINSIFAGGTIVSGGSVQHSILFPRVQIDDESIIDSSILFEGVHVGHNSHLKNCIVDKFVEIPPDTQIGFDAEADRERFTVSENGIVVVPSDYVFE